MSAQGSPTLNVNEGGIFFCFIDILGHLVGQTVQDKKYFQLFLPFTQLVHIYMYKDINYDNKI
jgi:hypothetical protein